MPTRPLLAALFVTTATAAIGASAPSAPVHQYGGLTLAPAGDRIATIEGGGRGGGHGAIRLRAVSDGRSLGTIDPCPACSYADLAFAPDGRLAFVARSGKTSTLMIAPAGGGAARALGSVEGLVQAPTFSPDGSRIAVLVTIGATKEAGATQAGARQVGEIGNSFDEQRIAIASSTRAGALTPISPADTFIYEMDWTHDGRSLLVSDAPGDGDANWWTATLDLVDASSGAMHRLAAPPHQIRYPKVSADGRSALYIGGLMSDYGASGGDVWSVPLAGGAPRNLTPGMRATALTLDMSRAGPVVTTLAGDRMQLGLLGAAPYYSAPVSLGAAQLSADGRTMAAVVQDFEHAPKILAGPVAAPRAITHDNELLPAPAKAQSLTWTSGGYTVQGWLLSSPTMAAGTRSPLLVSVHGGPSAASTPRYSNGEGSLAPWLAAGYRVLMPNPRGSFGQGEAFTRANIRDFGGGDLDDILAGIDAAKKVAAVDENRLGLMGCSYGGFMAMYANTRTNRFKAIVAGAGLSNWISYYGTNGINQWMIPFFGKSAYDDHKAYEDVSAVYRVDKARTPTFIYVGERDIEVPPTQSIEWYNALKAKGVPVSLVIYPDAGHCVGDPVQHLDVMRRAKAWFDRYLK
ncbi:S9 family peptidase [Sphingomonas sp. ASV193]|uniref:S9 family peptidase n=1 Tax=Sphingomonas sp. ASV193 TaxID=3144405 RepID=UPI0032E911AC